jgi:hypothetical protein
VTPKVEALLAIFIYIPMTVSRPAIEVSEAAVVLLSLDCYFPYVLVEYDETVKQKLLAASRVVTEKLIVPRSRGANKASRSHEQSVQAALFELLGSDHAERMIHLQRRLLCYEKVYRCESILRENPTQAALVAQARIEVSRILVDFLAISDQLHESINQEILEYLLMIPNPPWSSPPVIAVSATNLFDNVSHLSDYASASDWDRLVEKELDDTVLPSLFFSTVFQSNVELSFLEGWRLAMGSEGYGSLLRALALEFLARGAKPSRAFATPSKLWLALSIYGFEAYSILDCE